MPRRRNKIFISWSGIKARIVGDNLCELFNIAFPANIDSFFFSKQMDDGIVWVTDIFSEIKNAKFGIIILTRESFEKTWLNFEAGGIFTNKKDELSKIIPIFVDIDRETLDRHKSPLRFFQSDYQYNYESIEKLIKRIEGVMSWSINGDFYRENRGKKHIDDFLSKFNVPNPVFECIYKNDIKFLQTKGCIAEVEVKKPSDFYLLRKTIIENAHNSHLIISGQSLSEAFPEVRGDVACICNEVIKAVEEGKITKIDIFITDPFLLHQVDEVAKRIDTSLSVLKRTIFPVCEKMQCEVSVIFLPLLQIDHSVITNEFMAFRSTKLWTPENEFKGSWKIYSCGDEYHAHKSFLEEFKKISTRIDPLIDAEITEADHAVVRRQKEIRKEIFEKYEHISLWKLYYDQLVAFAADKWIGMNGVENSFIGSDSIQQVDDLFQADNLLDDSTQQALLPYIKETREMFRKVIKKYDSSENSGVEIYPSLDLGIPNNIQRIAGGFTTGMFIMWKCGTPIIPVDATVNVCSSSVFKLRSFDRTAMSSPEIFEAHINDIMGRGRDEKGYSFSFDSGNHFLTVAYDEKCPSVYYLIMHSSAKEHKDSYLGLYPVEDNWYAGKIKKYPPQGETTRYFRYLKDNDAKNFIFLAQNLKEYNERIHLWFAEQWGGYDDTYKVSDGRNTFHHYYMPSENSIALGVFVESPRTIVPIFSNKGKPIYMFEISRNNWRIKIDNEEKCIIPHGWGQEIIPGENGIRISVDGENNRLFINGEGYEIRSTERIRSWQKKIRDFSSDDEFFEKGKKSMKGKVVQKLIPVYTYQKKE